MATFTLDYHRENAPFEEPERRSIVRGGTRMDPPPLHSDEAAARFHLSRRLVRDDRPVLRGLAAAPDATVLPDMRTTSTEESPLSRTRLVSFDQTRAAIPIFGTRVVVELDTNRELVSITGELTNVPNVRATTNMTHAAALDAVAAAAGVERKAIIYEESPSLVFFQDSTSTWHLCFLFRNVPVMPRDTDPRVQDRPQTCAVSHSFRVHHPLFDYLIDAHTGSLVYFYSAAPMADDPVRCAGDDEDGNQVDFFGRQDGNAFYMWDPWRRIKTYDYGFSDIATTGPTDPVSATAAIFVSPAAVSAHVNATAVYDFYNNVLQRTSIDGKGMEIISNVNCVSLDEATPDKPKQWQNASWWKGKMWYGQIEMPSGVRSFSRYLDIIAHELTHGVTGATAGLVYREQPGALNESFSDILGVIIKNWTAGRQKSVTDWDWEIGGGLGDAGGPLRDLSNPARTKAPTHMTEYVNRPVTLSGDWGGVHTNSNIHNKAAYNVLTAVTPAGKPSVSPKDAAVLYYLCLKRLNSTATFNQAFGVLINVANSYYAGNPDRETRVDAIREAYKKVGIV